MRTEYCRTHMVGDIGKFVAEGCITKEEGEEMIRDQKFRNELKIEFSTVSTDALRPLRREKDEEVKQKAISTIEKSLKYHRPPGSKTEKKITGKDMVQILAKARKEVKGTIELPLSQKGKYRTVVIDPPWEIEKIQREVRPNQIEMDYPTMPVEEIKSFSVPSVFDTNGCHVYLWTTHKHLPDALGIFEAWGVKYQCVLTWIKNVGITPFSWMYSTELVLFGRVGNLSLLKNGLRIDFNGKVREHSRKPDEFYDLVKQASPEPRIDIFSREKRDGFNQYGNEVDKF